MSDFCFSLISWLQMTGELEGISSFAEVGDCQPIINAFCILFPEIEIKQNGKESAFLQYIVTNKPKSYVSSVSLTYNLFISCDPETLEEISKIILLIYYQKNPQLLLKQLARMPAQERMDILEFLPSEKNEMKENFRFASNIRSFCKELDRSLQLGSIEESLDKQNDEFCNQFDSIIKAKSDELNKEISRHIREAEKLEQSNKIMKNEIDTMTRKCEEMKRKIESESGESSDKHATVFSERERLKKDLAANQIHPGMKSKEGVDITPILCEYVKTKNMAEKMEKENINLKEKFEDKIKSNIIQAVENDPKLTRMQEEIARVEELIRWNVAVLENERKNGETRRLIEELEEARNERDDVMKEYLVIHEMTTKQYNRIVSSD